MLSSSVWRARSRWWFSAGLLVGGTTSSLFAVAIGSLMLRPFLPEVIEIGIVGLVLILVVGNEFGIIKVPLPQNGRQVPQAIVDDGAEYGALQFGFEMGTGVRTYMTSGLPHALAAVLVLTASWPEGLLAGMAFGAGRAWMTISRHARYEDQSWDEELERHDKHIRMILAVAFTAVVAATVRTMLGEP